MQLIEHITLYSKKYIPDNYSVNISILDKDVNLNIGKSKIKIINDYRIAIRICELKNLFLFFGVHKQFGENYREYKDFFPSKQSTLTSPYQIILVRYVILEAAYLHD